MRFLLDGEVIKINEIDPTRTVLQYLREDLQRTGTKEGCAEGDCGACMVAIATLNENEDGLDYVAINSCIQFVATLDGKALITVESLSAPNGSLHPVQQAMVDCHASQCGFCTPGFVMTLFALYQTTKQPDRRAINDALSGNLCRCTGYRPIVDAAVQMYQPASDDAADIDNTGQSIAGFSHSAEPEMVQQLKRLKRTDTLRIGSAGRQIMAPKSIDKLAELLDEHPGSTILAGGTDVGLWVTKQFRDMDSLIYIGDVHALKTMDDSGDAIALGAAVTFSEAAPVIGQYYPDIVPLLRRFASPPVRNAATIGGNIANGSPIGDSMPALMVLGTEVTLRKGKQQRVLPLESLYIDYMVNALEPGEFVENIVIPKPAPTQQFRTYKISKRFDQDISAICSAFALHLADGFAKDVRIAYGGVAGIPKRAAACEAALEGQSFNEAVIRQAMAALDEDFTPLTDMRASDQYRRQAAKNTLYRYFVALTQPDVALEVFDYDR